ncbi:carbohydrate ABC transporter permease [Cohnella suwonensis]|uniref:Carbohydrate ABC transporter permease n=1 Tax=Cohnella suwonensis TaxID=696072 RepID=A0ABW0M286_9BACL
MKIKSMFYRDGIWAFLMLLPNVVGFLMFLLLPVLATFAISFTDWDLSTDIGFVGFDNYKELVHDEVFHQVFWNTLYFTAVSVPIGIAVSLLLAIALNQKIRFVRFYRAAFFFPVISSFVAVAILWQWIYNPQFGLLNYALGMLGIKGPLWLTSPDWAMPAVILASIWKNLGFSMLIFLAGLQSISESYYEAADIDGASSLSKFWHITVPLLSPTTFFITVISVINSFQVFDTVYLMTQGGPARSTSVLVSYVFENAFQYFQMGYASAIAYVLFFLVLIVTFIQFWRQKKLSIY